MRVLIIGGNRFFGKRLAKLFLEQGVDVTLLNRGSVDDGFGNRVSRIQLDRKNLTKKHPQLSVPWDVVYDQVCYDAGEAALACDVFADLAKQYVFVSSQSVYGPGKNIPESAFDPISHQSSSFVGREQDYAEAKRQAEHVFFTKMSMPLTAVRFPIVLGEDDYTLRLKFHIDKIKEGVPLVFPNVQARISFIHAQDAANFLFSLAATKRSLGAVNCCSSEPVVLAHLIQRIERVLGKKAQILSQKMGGALSPFGVEADWFMGTEKVNGAGFCARPIELWIDSLIQYFK